MPVGMCNLSRASAFSSERFFTNIIECRLENFHSHRAVIHHLLELMKRDDCVGSLLGAWYILTDTDRLMQAGYREEILVW